MTRVRDEVERVLIETDFYAHTPFWWITLSIRYGLKNDGTPKVGQISKKYGDLPLSIEIDTHEILDCGEEEMCAVFRRATLRSLIYAGKKHSCPTERLEQMLAEQSPAGYVADRAEPEE
jgi:hypothetical protein